MAIPHSKITTYSDGTIKTEKYNTVNSGIFYRVNHDAIPLWRVNLPEVNRTYPILHVVLGEAVQWLWRFLNPQLTDDQWGSCLGPTLALTNNAQGFPGHANYIQKKDLDKSDPRFDQARLFGGYILKMKSISGGRFYFESIDVRKPIPSIEYVLEHPYLYGEAVNIDWQVFPDKPKYPIVRPFKNNWGKKVFVPLLTMVDNPYLPLSMMTRLNNNEWPSSLSYP